MKKNSYLVYSTDKGRITSSPANPESAPPAGDGLVRIRCETKGRRGKAVTVVSGIDLPADALKALARQLKQISGSGGSVKNGSIEIQGDHRASLQRALEQQGMKVKLI